MTVLYKDKFKSNSQRLQNWDYSSEAVYFITIVTKDRKCIFGIIEDEKMILNENGKIVENELLKSIKIRKNWFFHNWVIMPNHIHLLIEIQDQYDVNLDSNFLPESHIVETHGSASTSRISATENNINSDSNILTEQHIVETHGSASPSSISETENNISGNPLSTYGRETHSSAPLQNQSDVNSNSNFLSTTHIVETHGSASPSSISATENNKNSDSNFLPESHIVETHGSASPSSISTTKNNSESKFSRKSKSISSFVAIFKSVTTKQINGAESIWQANYHDHIVRNYKRFEKIYDYIKQNPRSWDTDSLK